jgi:hypothetical protein
LNVIEEKRTAISDLRKHTETERGLIGRVSDAINYKPEHGGARPIDIAATMRSPESMFIAVVAALLLLGIFIMPGYLTARVKSTTTAQQDMRMVEAQEEQDSEAIKEILTPEELKDHSQKTASLAVPVAPQSNPEASGAYLSDQEESVPARISRIQSLLKANKRVTAQKLCIATMKLKLNKAQFEAVWTLMRQSMRI